MGSKISNLKIGGKIVKEIYAGDKSIAKFCVLKYRELGNDQLIDAIGQVPEEKLVPPTVGLRTETSGLVVKYRVFDKWVQSNGTDIPNTVPNEDSTYYAKRYYIEMPNTVQRVEVSSSNLNIYNPFNIYTDTKLYVSFETPYHISVSTNSVLSGSKYKVNFTLMFNSYYVRPGQTNIHSIPVSFYTDSGKTNKICEFIITLEVYYQSLGGTGD